MELQPVSVGSVVGMMFSLAVAFGIPIGLFIYLWRKKKATFFSFAKRGRESIIGRSGSP